MSGPTISVIQEHVAAHFGVTAEDLRSRRSGRSVSDPRHIAMLLCRKLTPQSATAIGKAFGDRDHSTVIHAWRRAEERMESDPELRQDVDALCSRIADTGAGPAAGSPDAKGTARALRREARLLRGRADRLDALAEGLLAPAGANGQAAG